VQPFQKESAEDDANDHAGEQAAQDRKGRRASVEKPAILPDRQQITGDEQRQHQAEGGFGAARGVAHGDGRHGDDHESHARTKAAFGDADQEDAKDDDAPPEHVGLACLLPGEERVFERIADRRSARFVARLTAGRGFSSGLIIRMAGKNQN
jgi:hypothetical protein